MERQSAKHSPRLDEQLQQETESMVRAAPVESRVEEHREQEPAGDDEPVADALLQGGRDPVNNPNPDHDALQDRSELARFLEPSAFPGDRERLLAAAMQEQAPQWILSSLERLPDGSYANVERVWEALGGEGEQQRF